MLRTIVGQPAVGSERVDTGNSQQTTDKFDLRPNVRRDFSVRFLLSLSFRLKFQSLDLAKVLRHDVKFGLKFSVIPNSGLRLWAQILV